MTIEFWHWIVLALGLLALELMIPSMTLLWFGLGALIVALVVWINPTLALPWVILIWTIASIIFTVLWFALFKKMAPDRTTAGLSREAIRGQTGMVIAVHEDGAGNHQGTVRFSVPLVGAEEWPFTTTDPVAQGDRIAVIEANGNTLLVKKA